MEKASLLVAIRRHWLLALTCCLLIVLATGVATAAASPTYATTLRAFVSANIADPRIGGPYQGSLLAQSQVQSLAAIVSSPPVTQPVIQQLRLNMSTDQLASRISANVPLNTVLIDITVRDSDPGRARDIANAAGVQFSSVVSRLDGSAGASPVSVTVVEPAVRPTSPVSPRRLVNYLLGLMVGLALGAGAALLRESRSRRKSPLVDERIHSHNVHDVITLASFPQVADSEPLAVIADDDVKELRVGLGLLGATRRPGSILVTSLAAGEGRSTTCLNLAANLSEAGLRVALVEADAQQPSIASCLGSDGAGGLVDVLTKQQDLEDALRLVRPWANDRMLLLPHGTVSSSLPDVTVHARFPVVLRELEAICDIVVIDAPTLRRNRDTNALASLARPVVIVSRPGRSRRAAENAARALIDVGVNVLGIVENMVPRSALPVLPDEFPTNWGRPQGFDGERRTDVTAANNGIIGTDRDFQPRLGAKPVTT